MKIKIMKSLLSVAVLAAITNGASAAPIGTAAGTAVDNTAHISYKVGTVDQTDIYSSPGGNTVPGIPNINGAGGVPTIAGTITRFTVDKKIDLSVAKGADITVVPEELNKNITFTVTNEGNSTEFFKLEQSNVANGGGPGQDNFDPVAASCSITSPTSPVSIPSGDVTTVTVNCDMPVASTNVADGKKASIDLKATAVTDVSGTTTYSGTSGTDTAINAVGDEDIVLADGIGSATDIAVGNAGDRNATHSAVNNYNIVTANIEVGKTSAVFSDPFNGLASVVGNNPKRIPGAVVEYTITVQNTGTADATNLIISDPLPANTTFVASSCSISGAAAAPTCNISGANVVSTSFTLSGGETATLKFKATIQ